MPEKSPLEKIQQLVTQTIRDVAADPTGTASKAAGQVRGLVSLGLTVAGQVAHTVAERLNQVSSPPAPSAPSRPAEPHVPTPADVAEVVEMRPKPQPPAKKAPVKKAPAAQAPAKKAPVKKSTPSAKLPPKKAAPVKKAAPAEKAAPAKTAAKKAPAKKAPAKKAPAKKATPRTAAEVLEDTSVTTPVGTTGADTATNPDTTETDLQQPGTAPLMDPATRKAVAREAETGARGADPQKG